MADLSRVAHLPGVTASAPDGSGDVLVTCADDATARVAADTLSGEGFLDWTGPRSFYVRAAKGHRRCESCGMAMRPRLYRARDDDDRLVCDGCKATGLGPKEWNVAYASANSCPWCDEKDPHGSTTPEQCTCRDFCGTDWCQASSDHTASLPPAYAREAQVRHDATVAGLALLAEVRKCPSCAGQGTYEDDDGRERSCPRCGGDGVLDVPAKTSSDWAESPTSECEHTYHRTTESGQQEGWDARPDLLQGGYWVPCAKKTGSLQTVAHDSGDGETIFHCPFCGSGAVVGGADGTVTCDFCHTAFTVQVQPTHTNMPQTVEGQPYNIPGMPGGGPDAGAATQDTRQDAGQAQEGAPAPGSSPSADANKGKSPAADKAAQDGAGAPEAKKPNPFAKGSHLVVNGGVLPLDTALQALALAHADDRDAVLTQVRAENAR